MFCWSTSEKTGLDSFEATQCGSSAMRALPARCTKLLLLFLFALLVHPLAEGGSFQKTQRAAKYISTQEDAEQGIFSDLSTSHDGGVANPTDGSTGNALQQTLIDAYFWGVAHSGARATVVAASDYPVSGSRILIPGNVDLVCSSYSPQTYTGGCTIYQSDPGNNTLRGGSPLLVADFSIGVLADHKTKCSLFDNPAQPGCTIINSTGGSISGFTLYGGGAAAGGEDVGIRVAADNFSVQDTKITGFFGGPGIQNVTGVNNSYDWNYGTNVDAWWCANPSQITAPNLNTALLIEDGNLGGMELSMVDGEASHNQYSTGCAFPKGFTASLEYPYLAPMHVAGAGNLIQANLLQIDGIGLIVSGEEQRVLDNRVEFQAREGILSYAGSSLFSGNHILSACLDANLPNLRPGAPNNGIPTYPNSPSSLHPGYILMDSNGNVEQDVYGNQANGYGSTDASAPVWPITYTETLNSAHIVWENSGPWVSGMTSSTDDGSVPAMTSGLCYGVKDVGQENSWADNQVGVEEAVNGPSYYRGSYFILFPGALSGNTCDQDQPDANRNGQCWWGGDLFSNGGPPGLQPNGKMISAAGGGTAWVGDYSVVLLTDATPQTYNNFQGMSDGQFFWVTSSNAANVIDTWGVNGSGSLYGHPSLLTCGGLPLTIAPNAYYEFYYSSSTPWGVTQVNCGSQQAAGTLSLSPASLSFAPQVQGTTSTAQIVTLTNSGPVAVTTSIRTAGEFTQTNDCGTALAPGAVCSIAVSFLPRTLEDRTGSLTVTNTLGGATYTIGLSGTGAAVVSSSGATINLSTASLVFASQVKGTTSSAQFFTLTNTGSSDAVTADITVVGDFAQTNKCGAMLAAGASCTVSVTFNPTAIGSRNGVLTVTNGSDGSASSVSLSGTGESATGLNASIMSLSSTSLTFASQLESTTSSGKTLQITNLGSAALSVSIAATGDFAQSNTCSTPISSASSCVVTVMFTPTGLGNRAGALNVSNITSSSAQAIALSGVGVLDSTTTASGTQTTIAVSSSVPSLTINAAGPNVTAPFVVSSVGGFTGNVNLTCSVVYQGDVTPSTQPSCSLTSTQTYLSGNVQGASSLIVSTSATTASNQHQTAAQCAKCALAGLIVVGLLPGMRRRRTLYIAYLCVIFMSGMVGCGVTQNQNSSAGTQSSGNSTGTGTGSYQVLVTATSGKLTATMSIPLTVQ